MSEMTRQRRLLVLGICCMSLLIVGLDSTIVNVALPKIQTDLHASVSGLQWTIDAYTLVLASLLMLSGSTGDRMGRRRTFQTGLVIFTLGSLLCSLAPGLGWLIAFRMVQAVGGSMLNPVAMSIITNVFTEPKERAQAIGVWGGVIGISLALGPIVGGALVDSIGWRSIFWINVPVGILALILTILYVPESRADHPRRVDPIGQVLIFVFLSTLTYAIIEGPGRGWGSDLIIALFAVSAASIVCFVAYEQRRAEPLIDPRFFASLPFSAATVIAVCAFGALSGFLFMNTLYLQKVREFTPLHAGLATVPIAVTTLIFAPLSGRIVGRRGTRIPLLISGLGLTAAGLMLTRLTNTTPIWWLYTTYVVFGLGFAMVNAPITNTAVSGMPRAQAGVAAAIASTSRQVGATLGVAIIGSAVVTGINGRFEMSFSQASHIGWWIIAGSGLVVLVLGLASSGPRAAASAAAVRERLMSAPAPAPDPDPVKTT
jgi:EmrB/QacA subfamily drug resistance transporter